LQRLVEFSDDAASVQDQRNYPPNGGCGLTGRIGTATRSGKTTQNYHLIACTQPPEVPGKARHPALDSAERSNWLSYPAGELLERA